MSNDKNSVCCNGDCNQGRTCPVRLGTYKPAEAVHQIEEPYDIYEVEKLARFFESMKKSSHIWYDGVPVHEKAAAILRAQLAELSELRAIAGSGNWLPLLKEARDNCQASIAESGISSPRREYRKDLLSRLDSLIERVKVALPK